VGDVGSPLLPRVRAFFRQSRDLRLAVAGIALASLVAVRPAAQSPAASDRIWFAPDIGTLDFVNLFEHPEEWPRTRGLIDVFKFYQQHTFAVPPPNVGPNSYTALVQAGAFQRLTEWGIKIALEAGSVKEFYCTSDASGMNQSIQNTMASLAAVEQAGGSVSYLAMDEPWVAGRSTKCGGPALEPTADRVAAYMTAVQQARPALRIGLIEAYPFSSADAIGQILQLMRARGVPPAFLHMDVDWHSLAPGDFQRDMTRLKALCDSQGIPFGIIIVGYNGDADVLYAADAGGIANLIADTFGTWDAMPQHIIFQSWVVSSTGLSITPSNLPEGQLDTHTNLIFNLARHLHGTVGGPKGTAVPRS
jgi:hypothetical protein